MDSNSPVISSSAAPGSTVSGQAQGADEAQSQEGGDRPLSPHEPPNEPPNGPRPPRAPRPLYRRWAAWVLMVLVSGGGGAAAATFHTIDELQLDLPDAEDALVYERDGTLTIRAGDGSILQQLGPATRDEEALDDLPEDLINAFIASEDRKFYEHNGVDYRAIARAAYANFTAGEVVEGASTITQQLTRIVYLGSEQSISRKVREAFIAHRLEAALTKEQILERYLNLVYLGSGAYGVADAAWIYFGKPVEDLTLPEIATIAGIAPAPSSYSPLVDPELAKQRRNVVLQRMGANGFITLDQQNTAIASPLEVMPNEPRNLYSRYPFFTIYIQQELPQLVSQDALEEGGLTIETTLNPALQDTAQETMDEALENYGSSQRFSEGAMVSIDPRTGEVLALVGGSEFNESQFNRAVQAMRQPGSTFKTFVYAAAIGARFSPYKSYVDGKLFVDGYEPENYGKRYSGERSMREALISSINTIAVQVLIDVGFDPVIELAQKMGIQSELRPEYSMALGSIEVTPLELTSAYGTLANDGVHVPAHAITRITNRRGEVLYEFEDTSNPALDPEAARLMTWMLRGVVNEGTGGNAALRGRPVAGKTGTSEELRDLWFVGYIPQMATGVWFGNDDNRPTRGASSTAARVWRNFMEKATEDMPVENFEAPPQRLIVTEQTIEPQQVRPGRLRVTRVSPDGREERRTTSSGGDRESGGSSRPAAARSTRRQDAAPAEQEPAQASPRASDEQERRPTRTYESAAPEPSPEAAPPSESAPAPAPALSPIVPAPVADPAAERPSSTAPTFSIPAPAPAPPPPPAPPAAAPAPAPPPASDGDV